MSTPRRTRSPSPRIQNLANPPTPAPTEAPLCQRDSKADQRALLHRVLSDIKKLPVGPTAAPCPPTPKPGRFQPRRKPNKRPLRIRANEEINTEGPNDLKARAAALKERAKAFPQVEKRKGLLKGVPKTDVGPDGHLRFGDCPTFDKNDDGLRLSETGTRYPSPQSEPAIEANIGTPPRKPPQIS